MATQRGLYKMYIADEVTIRDLDDNYIAETDNIEMAFRIVDLLTEQDLTKKVDYLKGTETIDELLEEYERGSSYENIQKDTVL